MRIATYLNAEGELGDFLGAGSICVFDKQDGRWEMASSTPLCIDANLSLGEMKQTFAEVVHPITQCQVFLVNELRGIFKVFLEDWGFHVWKSAGTLEQQLEQVETLENNQAKEDLVQLLPAPSGDAVTGVYRIDLIELMKSGVPHVSREILLPFFDTTAFTRLEVISDHVPRWLPFEMEELGLRIESQTQNPAGEGLQLIIVPVSGARSCPKGRRKRNFSCGCGG